MKNLLETFATEEISKDIISIGFTDVCVAKHAGFKQFGEGDDKMQNKFIYNSDLCGPWTELQQKQNMPFFTICPAPTWQQITNWFRDVHDIDIDVTHIRHDPEFKFLYSIMIGGKLVDSGRTITNPEAFEKAVKSAIELRRK